MRWEAYMADISRRLAAPMPEGFTVHFDGSGEVTNEVTPDFPCGWDERDAKV